MGAIRVLAGIRERLRGSVRFVFQPAEEETGGGRRMVENGLLDTEPRPLASSPCTVGRASAWAPSPRLLARCLPLPTAS